MNPLAFVTLWAAALTAGTPFVNDTTEITWIPAEPVQGSLVELRVRPATEPRPTGPVTIVRGSLSGQPLYFEPRLDGTFSTIGAVSISAGDTVPLALEFAYLSGAERQLTVNVPVRRGRFPSERLSVARRFTTAPDAALQRRIARERARSRAAYRRSHDTPRLWSETFIRPRRSRITSAFGTARVFNGRLRSRHMGTDFDGNEGDPIRASNRGLVTLVGNFYYSGRVVYLDHGRGLLTAYLHMSQVNVSEGDLVERGQVIGRVGSTGRVTGPHLHWIARHGAITTNPMSLLTLETREPSATESPANP